MATQIAAALGIIRVGNGRQVVRTSSGILYSVINSGSTIRVYKSSDGSSWTQQDISNSPAVSGNICAIAIDSTNILHIPFFVSGTGIRYITFATSTDLFGSIETIIAGNATNINVIAAMDIATDSNNVPHVAVSYDTSGGTHLFRYFQRTTGTWSTFINIASITNGVTNLSLLLDNNNLGQVAYTGLATSIAAAIGNLTAATSFTNTTLDTTFTNTNVSICLDGNYNTWLSYEDVTNGTVNLIQHLASNSWATWQTAVSSASNGKTTSVGSVGNNIYVFYEPTAATNISYDRYNGTFLGQQTLQTGTFHNPRVKYSVYNNNQNNNQIDYLFDDGTTVYWDKIYFPSISGIQSINGIQSITF